MNDQIQQQADLWDWNGDVYNRGAYAKFLTDYLRGKTTSEAGRHPSCMALDAEWGAGKTFFVDHWIDTLNKQGAHISFKFNAWEADFQADPLVAFMAEFRDAIQNQLGKHDPSSVGSAQEKLASTIKHFGRLAKPLLKAMAIGMANKFIPGAAEEIVNTVTGSNDDHDGMTALMEGVLSGSSEYITKALDEQIGRKQILADFKKATTELIDEVAKLESEHRLPIFIFVDELDRCRPDFAVQLLEGLKHVFSIEGLCFVVSTNIDQLSHAITAIYGNGFDGRNYLGRFFDCIYSLPKNDKGEYIRTLCNIKNIATQNTLFLITPSKSVNGFKNDVPAVLGAVSKAFDLTPREQEKYISYIDTVLSSLDDQHVHIWWLAILAAAKVKKHSLFNEIYSLKILEEGIGSNLSKFFPKTEILKYQERSVDISQDKIISVSLEEIAKVYIAASKMTKGDFFDALNNGRRSVSFKSFVYEYELTGSRSSPTTISKYPFMIECAGHIFV